jgi:hypothetical protein
MFVKHQAQRYGGEFALKGTPLGDYQKVTFVLPTNTTSDLRGLGQLPQLTGMQWAGVAAVAAALAYWLKVWPFKK